VTQWERSPFAAYQTPLPLLTRQSPGHTAGSFSAGCQHSQVLIFWAAFQSLLPKPVVLHGVVVTQVQDLAFGLVEPCMIYFSPSIQPIQLSPKIRE